MKAATLLLCLMACAAQARLTPITSMDRMLDDKPKSKVKDAKVENGGLTLSTDNVQVNILGHSGKIRIRPAGNDTDACTIEMDSIKEYDSAGDEVGNHGSEKHSINSFASQDFSFGDLVTVDVGNTTADAISFSATMETGALLNVTSYFILANGYVSINGTDYELKQNDYKFDIDITNWTWVSGNTDGFLEFVIEVKGRGGKEMEQEHSHEGRGGGDHEIPRNKTDFALGDSTSFIAPTAYQVDGEWFQMPDGYPSMEIKGSKTLLAFRFEHFDGHLTYDPTVTGVSATNDSGDNGDGINAAGISTFPLFASLLMGALMRL